MVVAGKLLAAGHVTSCCPAYISGRRHVLPPLEGEILTEKTWKRTRTRIEILALRFTCATDEEIRLVRRATYDLEKSVYEDTTRTPVRLTTGKKAYTTIRQEHRTTPGRK